MPTILFLPDNIRVTAQSGTSLLDAARACNVALESPCNGLGSCGKCLAVAIDGDCTITPADCAAPEGYVLACQTFVGTQDATIRILRPQASGDDGLQIHDSGDSIEFTLSPHIHKRYDQQADATLVFAGSDEIGREAGDTTKDLFGLAVDIGTTTLAVSLVGLHDAQELASATGLNPQTEYAQDVLGRVHFAGEQDGLRTLQVSVVKAINQLSAQVCAQAGVAPDRIYESVLSGNTCMIHLAAGLNPSALGKHPFMPEFLGHASFKSSSLGLSGAAFAQAYFPPSISGYVGADITAGIIATALAEGLGTTLFVDIGTNGEMALAKSGSLLATSTAAGPAFEGMNISCGMRAANGAIEYYHLEDTGEISLKTIGNAAAKGLCGSGLMDVVAELVRCGGVEPSGRFSKDGGSFGKWIERKEGKASLRLADGVYLTQKDIRQVQSAKAAIRTGIDLLLEEARLKAEEVEKIIIAGSFGYHLQEASLLDIGLLPAEFAGRVSFAGNTAKSGSRIFLLEEKSRERAKRIAENVRGFSLADRPSFQNAYISAMSFPKANVHTAAKKI